jgi:hypothetical protein
MEMSMKRQLLTESYLMHQNQQMEIFRKVICKIRQTLEAPVIWRNLAAECMEHFHVDRFLAFEQRQQGDHSLIIDHEGSPSRGESKITSMQFSSCLLMRLECYDGIFDCPASDPLLFQILGPQASSHRAVVMSCKVASKTNFVVLTIAKYLDLEKIRILLNNIREHVVIALDQASQMRNERLRIKEIAEMNDALIKANKEIENAKTEREFLAIMSHEMRTVRKMF